MRAVKTISIIYILTQIIACSPVTPFVAAGVGSREIAMYQQNQRIVAAAAVDEEPDLLTFSVKGIVNKNSEEVVKTYMLGYGKNDYSQDMKSIAIYQIALLYMSRLNHDRDDEKAKLYLQRHLIEFPHSMLKERVEKRLAIIEKRKTDTYQPTPEQIVANADRARLLSKPTQVFDEDLTPMSERAIKEDRLVDANGIYITVYNNPGSSDAIKAKSLYQLGLIYKSPHNKNQSLDKARFFFNKVINEFPKSPEAHKSWLRINRMVNNQS